MREIYPPDAPVMSASLPRISLSADIAAEELLRGGGVSVPGSADAGSCETREIF
jgi:hypothetical protein